MVNVNDLNNILIERNSKLIEIKSKCMDIKKNIETEFGVRLLQMDCLNGVIIRVFKDKTLSEYVDITIKECNCCCIKDFNKMVFENNYMTITINMK